MTKSEILDKARREYPMGTVYVCARDLKQVVTRVGELLCHEECCYTMIDGDDHYQFIYDGEKERWAEIKSVPEPQIINEYQIF